MASINGKEVLFSTEVNIVEGGTIDTSDFATKADLQDLANSQTEYVTQTLTKFEQYMDEKHASKEELNEEFAEFSTAYDQIIDSAKNECKQYTDTQIGNIETALTEALTELHNYAMNLKGGEA